MNSLIGRRLTGRAALLTGIFAAAGCSDSAGGAVGKVRVLVESEDTITEGLEAGPGPDNIHDGWNVHFDQYLAALGNVELRQSRNPDERATAAGFFVIDLTKLSAQGDTLWELDELEPGRWEFHYELGPGDRDLERHGSVVRADYQRFEDEGLTYLIRGTLEKEDGVSCPPSRHAMPPSDASVSGENGAGDTCYHNDVIAFEWAVSVPTSFGPCEVDGLPGVSVPEGGTATVAVTLHGDHLFFNGFPTGTEGGITRLAQLWADADLDIDGELTRSELESLTPSDMPEFDERYQVGGTPLVLDSLWTYARAQLSTQGHMDGEGECPIDEP